MSIKEIGGNVLNGLHQSIQASKIGTAAIFAAGLLVGLIIGGVIL